MTNSKIKSFNFILMVKENVRSLENMTFLLEFSIPGSDSLRIQAPLKRKMISTFWKNSFAL